LLYWYEFRVELLAHVSEARETGFGGAEEGNGSLLTSLSKRRRPWPISPYPHQISFGIKPLV
jgi:hypothetical protein